MLYLLGFLLKKMSERHLIASSIICNSLRTVEKNAMNFSFSISLSPFEFLFQILMFNLLPRWKNI